MNLKIKSTVACFVVLLSQMSMAKSENPPPAMAWGEPVDGVQLGIAMTNTVFHIPSTAAVSLTLTNGSRRGIKCNTTHAEQFVILLLTNNSGMSYEIGPKPAPGTGVVRHVTIKPGSQRTETIPVRFDQNFNPGVYVLRATRQLEFFKGSPVYVSGPLTLRLTK